MAEYLIQGETLTAIGDGIRGMTGGTATLSPAEMASTLEGIGLYDGSYECSGDSTGGGSGGATLETCTVTLNFTGSAEGYGDQACPIFFCTKAVSGVPQYTEVQVTSDSYAITDVLVGSMMFANDADLASMFSLSTVGATLRRHMTSYGILFSIEETAQITWS